jgi:hypothetical protein
MKVSRSKGFEVEQLDAIEISPSWADLLRD